MPCGRDNHCIICFGLVWKSLEVMLFLQGDSKVFSIVGMELFR